MKSIFLWVLCGCLLKQAPFENKSTQEPTEHKVFSKGVPIHYRVFGKGETVVIINGGFGIDSVGFEGLAELLGKSHRVILFDRRGLGKSSMQRIDQSNMTMDLLVADMEAIRQDLGIESWSVLGHSFGGMVAAYYASKYPTNTKKVVFSSSAGIDRSLFATDNKKPIHARLSKEDRAELLGLENAYNAGDKSQRLLERFSQVLARAYVYDDKHSPLIAKRLQRADHQIGKLLSEDLKRISFDTKPALKQFRKPVLIIQGKQDVMTDRIAHLTHETLPNSQLVILEQCGHYGWIDQPQQYMNIVVGFLRSH